MSGQRRGGIIQLQANGALEDAKGEFSYNLGQPKREPVLGSDRPHGFTEKPQVPFIEGAITDRGNLDLKAMVNLEDGTITLKLAVGKTVVLRGAYYAGDGTAKTDEGEIMVRFEGASAEEI